jgi:hypothetical protein
VFRLPIIGISRTWSGAGWDGLTVSFFCQILSAAVSHSLCVTHRSLKLVEQRSYCRHGILLVTTSTPTEVGAWRITAFVLVAYRLRESQPEWLWSDTCARVRTTLLCGSTAKDDWLK